MEGKTYAEDTESTEFTEKSATIKISK